MPPARSRPAAALLLALAALAAAAAPGRAAAAPARLRLATTTSTESSGLLGHVLPAFEASCGCTVDVIAVGTGKALKLGEQGDVDVVLVHARTLEDRFVAEGWGAGRADVMYNDFVLLGPEGDPAGVVGAADAAEAFRRIARTGSTFVSRGDRSGTHEKELETWRRAGISPRGGWYLEAGQGMAEVIAMAVERGAYALADRATYLAHRSGAALRVVLEGDPALFNPYGVIPVSPRRHPAVNHALALRLVEFLTGPDGQRLIAGFRVSGQPLFFTGRP